MLYVFKDVNGSSLLFLSVVYHIVVVNERVFLLRTWATSHRSGRVPFTTGEEVNVYYARVNTNLYRGLASQFLRNVYSLRSHCLAKNHRFQILYCEDNGHDFTVLCYYSGSLFTCFHGEDIATFPYRYVLFHGQFQCQSRLRNMFLPPISLGKFAIGESSLGSYKGIDGSRVIWDSNAVRVRAIVFYHLENRFRGQVPNASGGPQFHRALVSVQSEGYRESRHR